MSLLLIKPKILSFKNRFLNSRGSRQTVYRDLIIAILAISITASIYKGTLWMLKLINSAPGLGNLPPFMPMNGVLFMLMLMLLLSNTLIAIGGIYFGQNNDLLLASPISRGRLFFSRAFETAFSSSWMPATFLIPFFVAFKNYYKIDTSDFLLCSLALIPFFVIPVSLSVIIALAIGWLLPQLSRKYLKVFFIVVFGSIFFYLASVLFNALTNRDPSAEVYRMLKILSSPLQSFAPSSWVVSVFEEKISPTTLGPSSYFMLLLCSSICLTSFGAFLFESCYSRLFSRVVSNGSSDKKFASDSIPFRFFGRFTNSLSFSLIKKELRILIREASSFIEVLLLVSMAFLYAYNLRSLAVVSIVPENQMNHWQNVLFLLTSLMTIFLITALSNRLVFPSISREGKAFWLLKVSPVTFNQILEIKHRCWFPLIYFVAFLFINISAAALSANADFLIISNLLVAISCYTITKIALGLGSKFAIFDWEHPSQLIASFGSFIFIAISIAYSAVLFVPIWFFSFFPGNNRDPLLKGVFTFSCFVYIILLSGLLVRYFSRQGVQKLDSMQA